jgi:hypothetical protein
VASLTVSCPLLTISRTLSGTRLVWQPPIKLPATFWFILSSIYYVLRKAGDVFLDASFFYSSFMLTVCFVCYYIRKSSFDLTLACCSFNTWFKGGCYTSTEDVKNEVALVRSVLACIWSSYYWFSLFVVMVSFSLGVPFESAACSRVEWALLENKLYFDRFLRIGSKSILILWLA